MASKRSYFCALFTSFCLVAASPALFASDSPSLDMNSNGNAACAWFTYDSSSGNILLQTNTFIGSSWGSPATLPGFTPASNLFAPKIAVITNVNNSQDISAVVIWSQPNGAGYMSVYASTYVDTSSGWSSPAEIASGTESAVGSTQYFIKIDPAGNAIALWSAVDSSGNEYIRSSTSYIYNQTPNVWSSTPTSVSGP